MIPADSGEPPLIGSRGTRCLRREQLQNECADSLKKISDVTARCLAALQSGDRLKFDALDRELEHSVGAKERAFGALWAHCGEHGC